MTTKPRKAYSRSRREERGGRREEKNKEERIVNKS
jgi:hypothetical protein